MEDSSDPKCFESGEKALYNIFWEFPSPNMLVAEGSKAYPGNELEFLNGLETAILPSSLIILDRQI